jgi:hypothetical protein
MSLTQNTHQTVDYVIEFLLINGVVLDKNEISNYILIKQGENQTQTQTKTKFVKKQKQKNTKFVKKQPKNTTVVLKNTTKFVKKQTKKFKLKAKEYCKFIDICNEHNLYYFEFNDEYNWKGPAIKTSLNDNNTIFDGIELTSVQGFNFKIIHPKKFEIDTAINYTINNYNDCILYDNDTLSINGSDTESNSDSEDNKDNKDNKDNEDSESEIIPTEDWYFSPENTMYQFDSQTNNLYDNNTLIFVGKVISDYEIDFEAKE